MHEWPQVIRLLFQLYPKPLSSTTSFIFCTLFAFHGALGSMLSVRTSSCVLLYEKHLFFFFKVTGHDLKNKVVVQRSKS